MLLFVLSQVFVIINYAFVATSYAVKSRKLLLIFGFFSLIANAIAYIFLSAWSGLAMVSVAILRNIVFMIQNKKEDDTKLKPVDYFILAILLGLIALLAWITYNGPLSLFSVFATTLFSISVWQKNILVYNVMGIIVSICWIIYDIFVWSPVAIVCEIILLLFMIGTLIEKQVRKKKLKNASTDLQSKDESDGTKINSDEKIV